MKLKQMELLAGLLLLAGNAFAEGGSCPAGYYPVGGQGTQGCAPIPNYNGGRHEEAAHEPTGYWEKTWGAIVSSETGGALGTATGASSKRQAEEAAMNDCRAKGGAGCKVELAYHNQCAVMVIGNKSFNTYGAVHVSKATEIGMQDCNSTQDGCRVY